MSKKWYLLAGGILLIGLVLAVIFASRKSWICVEIKKGKITSSSGLTAQAKDYEARGNLLEARAIYQRLLNEFPASGEVANWQKKTEDLNIALIFSPVAVPNSVVYEIRPGDTVARIARQFKTTSELIIRSNNLSGDKIMPGRKIKVWNAPFSMLVDKRQNILLLKVGEDVIKTYIVSTGVNNCTPTGTFKIANKLVHPTWFKAGAVVPSGSPANVLGSRWMGFDLAGYGIHGTTDPQSLGKQVTQGCVRLSNTDVEELYTLIPAGTEVTIVD